MVSPIRKLRILNANQTFSNDPQIDEYIKNKAQEMGIEVVYGANLNQIDSENQKLMYSQGGKNEEREFNLLYVHAPAKKNSLYEGLDISNNGIQVQVNEQMQTKYSNIFATGDCVENQT